MGPYVNNFRMFNISGLEDTTMVNIYLYLKILSGCPWHKSFLEAAKNTDDILRITATGLLTEHSRSLEF